MILQLFAIDDDKLVNFSFNHSDQVDEYGKSVGDYQAVQNNLDSRAEEVRVKHNALIDTLTALTAAGELGYTGSVPGVQDIAAALDLIYSGGSGSIPPDGTITKEKLASDVLTLLQGWIRPVSDNTLRIDELSVAQGVTSITGPNSEIYYDYVNSGKNFTAGTVDRTKAYCETATTGATSADVTSMINGLITDYKTGMQVTIQDDNGKEDILIDSVADPVINFKSQIQGTYSAGANVYRSNLTDDWKFGGFSSMGVIDKTTPSQLVNAPDSTIGNVGRRGCADDDGNMYFATVTANSLRVTKEGVGEIYSFNTGNTINGLSITYAQNRLHLIVNGNTFTEVKYIALDLTGIELVNTPLDSGQTAIGKCDITVNEFGGKNKILATWASINASLPTYFNIRAVEGTISGGVVTWGSITQITNEAARNVTDPTAKFINGDNPLIIYDDNDNLKCEIIGSSAFTIETSGGYNKDNLSATFMPPSKVIETGVDLGNPTDNANAQANGILLVAYEGKDPTDTTKNNIRCKISVNASAAVWLDFGVSGSKVTQGNVTEYRLPSPSWNDKGEFFLMYYKDSGNIYQSKWDTLWTVNTQITTNSDISPNCVDNYHNYDEPITFYQDTTDSDVKIYGKWTAGLLTPVTEIDIRVNIEAFTDKTEISAFLETNDFDTVTLDGFLSIHADGADETYIDTTDVKIDEGTNNMYLSAGSVVTPQDKATMKYQLTRASTSDAVEIKRVQGGLL